MPKKLQRAPTQTASLDAIQTTHPAHIKWITYRTFGAWDRLGDPRLLPYGVVLHFTNPDPMVDTCGPVLISIFYLTTAAMKRLFTAVLSAVLLVLTLFSRKGYVIMALVFNAITLVPSLLPLCYDLRSYSVVGFLISLLLAACFAVRLTSLRRRD